MALVMEVTPSHQKGMSSLERTENGKVCLRRYQDTVKHAMLTQSGMFLAIEQLGSKAETIYGNVY